jgi:hypothetical protein
MKILANFISASTQLHVGKCFFIGLVSESSKDTDAYNVEASGNAAAGNKVGYAYNGKAYILPKPGVECSNGLYVAVGSDAMVYWSLG